MPDAIRIRAEEPGDEAGLRALHEAAFGRAEEARLVDELRAAGLVVLSLVALSEERIVGHVLFSRAAIEGPRAERPAVALAPMAVEPAAQRRGIGSALVRAGLARLGELGERVVIVLGHPEYYPRFGFEPASPHGIRCDWPVPDDVFLVLALVPGALEGVRGRARYAPQFDSP